MGSLGLGIVKVWNNHAECDVDHINYKKFSEFLLPLLGPTYLDDRCILTSMNSVMQQINKNRSGLLYLIFSCSSFQSIREKEMQLYRFTIFIFKSTEKHKLKYFQIFSLFFMHIMKGKHQQIEDISASLPESIEIILASDTLS